MNIEWYGSSSFLLRTAARTVAVDPGAGLSSGADIVVRSRSASPGSDAMRPGTDEGVFVVAGPGEYEIGGVFIIGMTIDSETGGGAGSSDASGASASADEGSGTVSDPGAEPTSEAAADRGRAVSYLIDADELTICHLGALSAMPKQELVEALGPVDVLLLPVGGRQTLGPTEAVELVGQVEPSVIVPTHFGSPDRDDMAPVERFLGEMGVEAPEPLDTLEIAANRLPLEPKVVLLRPRS